MSVLLAGLGGAPSASDVLTKGKDWRQDYRRPELVFPASNSFSEAKADLGRTLFFDPLLSRSRTIACATCHQPDKGWSDGLPIAKGEGAGGASMRLRTPTLLDMASLERLGWDGKYRDIEAVTFAPIVSPANMNLDEATLIARLKADPTYVDLFAQAFPDAAISRRNVEKALATYERTIVSDRAPFDRWVDGDETAMSASAKRGFAVFSGKGKCTECHSGWAFTDGSFHDIGVGKDDDIGRGRYFPTSQKLRYAFKTPTLRDIARRGPFMHDGSITRLEDVIDLYDKGGIDRPSRAEVIKPLHLTAPEKADLLAFLKSLTGDSAMVDPSQTTAEDPRD